MVCRIPGGKEEKMSDSYSSRKLAGKLVDLEYLTPKIFLIYAPPQKLGLPVFFPLSGFIQKIMCSVISGEAGGKKPINTSTKTEHFANTVSKIEGESSDLMSAPTEHIVELLDEAGENKKK